MSEYLAPLPLIGFTLITVILVVVVILCVNVLSEYEREEKPNGPKEMKRLQNNYFKGMFKNQ